MQMWLIIYISFFIYVWNNHEIEVEKQMEICLQRNKNYFEKSNNEFLDIFSLSQQYIDTDDNVLEIKNKINIHLYQHNLFINFLPEIVWQNTLLNSYNFLINWSVSNLIEDSILRRFYNSNQYKELTWQMECSIHESIWSFHKNLLNTIESVSEIRSNYKLLQFLMKELMKKKKHFHISLEEEVMENIEEIYLLYEYIVNTLNVILNAEEKLAFIIIETRGIINEKIIENIHEFFNYLEKDNLHQNLTDMNIKMTYIQKPKTFEYNFVIDSLPLQIKSGIDMSNSFINVNLSFDISKIFRDIYSIKQKQILHIFENKKMIKNMRRMYEEQKVSIEFTQLRITQIHEELQLLKKIIENYAKRKHIIIDKSYIKRHQQYCHLFSKYTEENIKYILRKNLSIRQ